MRSRRRPLVRLSVWVAALGLAACGGAGPDSGVAAAPPAGVVYPHGIVLGGQAEQSLVYRPALGAQLASVTATQSSALLRAGTTALVAEHVEPALPGLRIVCVSGRGDSTNVIGDINVGVVAESAAVLLDDSWSAVDPGVAWQDVVNRGTVLSGWENCGVKPEGPPSPSSRRVPTAEGGFTEDVYDGNPGTTYNVIGRSVSAAEVAQLLSPAGLLSTGDPLRPLQITWQAWRHDGDGLVFVEVGLPTASAPPTARGFIALYVPVR